MWYLAVQVKVKSVGGFARMSQDILGHVFRYPVIHRENNSHTNHGCRATIPVEVELIIVHGLRRTHSFAHT